MASTNAWIVFALFDPMPAGLIFVEHRDGVPTRGWRRNSQAAQRLNRVGQTLLSTRKDGRSSRRDRRADALFCSRPRRSSASAAVQGEHRRCRQLRQALFQTSNATRPAWRTARKLRAQCKAPLAFSSLPPCKFHKEFSTVSPCAPIKIGRFERGQGFSLSASLSFGVCGRTPLNAPETQNRPFANEGATSNVRNCCWSRHVEDHPHLA
jgi:hypothetical protein